MPERVIAFKCPYCGAIKKTLTIALRHERACIKNPNGINCMCCIHSYQDGCSGKLVCNIKQCECRRDISGNCTDFERKEMETYGRCED